MHCFVILLIIGCSTDLFTQCIYLQAISGCSEVPEDVAQKLAKRVNQPKVCCAISGKDGVFVFPSVPSGDYTLVKSITFVVTLFLKISCGMTLQNCRGLM